MGFYLHGQSRQNSGGALNGKPTTSYRAEVRAVFEVIWRVRPLTCIVTDCKSVCQILDGILDSIDKGGSAWWPDDDGCNDYWETIYELLQQNHAPIKIKCMPSHLDEDKKKEDRERYIAQGGCEKWIQGNCGADHMAKQGAKLAAPPEHLLAREKITRTFVRAVQRMAVHIWAAEKGLVCEKDADGHEADMDEEVFGFDATTGFNDTTDIYQDAFEDLLEATMPRHTGLCENTDPWAEDHQVDEQILPDLATVELGNNPSASGTAVDKYVPPDNTDQSVIHERQETIGTTTTEKYDGEGLCRDGVQKDPGANRQGASANEGGYGEILRRIVKCKANLTDWHRTTPSNRKTKYLKFGRIQVRISAM